MCEGAVGSITKKASRRAVGPHRAFRFAASMLIEQNMKEPLWLLCEELRGQQVWQHYIPSAMLFAANNSAKMEIANALLDFKRWLSGTFLDFPTSFNSALAKEILEHEHLTALSANRSTVRSGRWIDRMDLQGGPLAQVLLIRINEALQGYLKSRWSSNEDEMVIRAPITASLQAWATVAGPDGYELWHVHPAGWISGVYYVAVPNLSPSGPPRKNGCIQFGPFPFVRPGDSYSAVTCDVRPIPGQLLIFPSHFSHRTWPTETDSARICVAFDVVPCHGGTFPAIGASEPHGHKALCTSGEGMAVKPLA